MELQGIRRNFEHRSIQKRIDFIESYDFENDSKNRECFIEFIKNLGRAAECCMLKVEEEFF